MGKHLVYLFLVLLCGSVATEGRAQTKKLSYDRYACMVDRLSVDGFLLDKDRKLDGNGIVIIKGKHNPLIIMQYAFLCMYEYLDTGDERYLTKLHHQMEYLTDTACYDLQFDGRGAGYPYNYKFQDLKPSWYSGMTQGYAISLLLRYHELTGNKKARDLAEMACYSMLQPVSKGGSISKPSPGEVWIEEYPGSKKMPQVLNGYMNGLIGLIEYCDEFPNDSYAQGILDSTYASFRRSFFRYDKANWSCYDRKGKNLSENYMHYQMSELEQIFHLTGDSLLLDQLRLWAALAFGKKNMTKDQSRFLASYRDSSVPLGIDSINNRLFVTEFANSSSLSVKRPINSELQFNRYRNLKRLRRGKSSKNSGRWISVSARPGFYEAYFKFVFRDDLDLSEIEVFRGKASTKLGKRQKESVSSKQVQYPFGIHENIILDLGKRNASRKNPLKVDLIMDDPSPVHYAHWKTKSMTLQKGKRYRIVTSDPSELPDKVYYRMSDGRKGKFNRRAFRLDWMLDPLQPFTTTHSEYQFLFSYDWDDEERHRDIPVITLVEDE